MKIRFLFLFLYTFCFDMGFHFLCKICNEVVNEIKGADHVAFHLKEGIYAELRVVCDVCSRDYCEIKRYNGK